MSKEIIIELIGALNLNGGDGEDREDRENREFREEYHKFS